MRAKTGLLGIIGFFSVYAHAAPVENRMDELAAMTPETFAYRTLLEDDELEAVATFSTSPAFISRGSGDVWLRAFVDKANAQLVFQLVGESPPVRGAPNFYQANFLGPDGLETSKTIRINGDVDCGRYGCRHVETVGADISEATVRWLASLYTANLKNPMTVRFKSQGGYDHDVFLMPAEAAGLLLKVDEYRARKGLAAK